MITVGSTVRIANDRYSHLYVVRYIDRIGSACTCFDTYSGIICLLNVSSLVLA